MSRSIFFSFLSGLGWLVCNSSNYYSLPIYKYFDVNTANCSTGTIAKGAALLHQEGAREVYACTTHAVFRYLCRFYPNLVCCINPELAAFSEKNSPLASIVWNFLVTSVS